MGRIYGALGRARYILIHNFLEFNKICVSQAPRKIRSLVNSSRIQPQIFKSILGCEVTQSRGQPLGYRNCFAHDRASFLCQEQPNQEVRQINLCSFALGCGNHIVSMTLNSFNNLSWVYFSLSTTSCLAYFLPFWDPFFLPFLLRLATTARITQHRSPSVNMLVV